MRKPGTPGREVEISGASTLGAAGIGWSLLSSAGSGSAGGSKGGGVVIWVRREMPGDG